MFGAGNAQSGANDRIMTSSMPDANGCLRVNTVDMRWARYYRDEGHDAGDIPDPAIAGGRRG